MNASNAIQTNGVVVVRRLGSLGYASPTWTPKTTLLLVFIHFVLATGKEWMLSKYRPLCKTSLLQLAPNQDKDKRDKRVKVGNIGMGMKCCSAKVIKAVAYP